MIHRAESLKQIIAFIVTALACLTFIFEPAFAKDQAPKSTREQIDAIIKKLEGNGQFSGTVLVSVGGEVIYKGAFGMADLERDVPNRVNTQFRVASTTKLFTTLLIYHLIEDGKLRFNDRLSDLLPEYPSEKGAQITVHQLLTHTSGILGEWRIPELGDIERHRWSRDKLLKEIASRDLVFQPGTSTEYSNYGYALLGMIIERVGGTSYEKQLQERICRPAGMTRTRGDNNDEIIRGRALGYDFDYFAGPLNAPYLDMTFVFGYGHLLSTVEDLHRFYLALDDPEVLPPQFRTIFFDESGWRIHSNPVGQNGRLVYGNYLAVSVNGFAGHLYRIKEDGIFITILRNIKEPDDQIVIKWHEYLTSRVLAVLYNEPYEMPRKSAAYAVFEAVRDKGVKAGRRAYRKIVKRENPDYYVDEDEFRRLAELLPELNDVIIK